jgi:hypothetical protein
LVEATEEIGSNDYAADPHTGKLPSGYAPAIQEFCFSESILKLVLYFGDFVVDPFIQPAHFVLSDSIEELL